MKKNIVILTTFLCLLKPVVAQDFRELIFDKKIIYKVTYQPDSNNHQNKKDEYMELLINDSISLFESANKRKNDVLSYQRKTGLISAQNVKRHPTGFAYQIIKDKISIKTLDLVIEDGSGIGNENYFYVEDRDKLDWKLSQDTLTIRGMVCQKAELEFGNRKWIAWFTPEIAISDGPYKFCGLPGLIVVIQDFKNFWKFELVTLTNEKEDVPVNIAASKRPKFITKESFFLKRKEYRENYLEIQEASGVNFGTIDNRAAIKRNVEENFRKDNNCIELYPNL